MFRRARHLHIVAVLYAKTLVIVPCGAVGVCVVGIETETFQRRCDKSEIALPCSLNAEYSRVIRIHVLCNLECLVIARETELRTGVISECLHIHVVHVLIEQSETDKTYALEVVVGRKIIIERCCRLGVRIAYGSLLVNQIETLVGYESRIFGA